MNREEYDIMFRVEDAHWWYISLRWMLARAWQRSLPPPGAAPLRVLDVGCGTGATLSALPPSTRAFGIDFAPEAVRYCRGRGHASTAVASATSLPFASNSFDVAVSFDVFCHRSIPDKGVPLREIARVLVPGGYMLLNLPAYQWLYSSHDVHVLTDHRFTRGEMRSLVQEAGFEPVRLTYWNSVMFPAILATRLWRKFFPPQGSDLADPPGPALNRIFLGIQAFERLLVRLHDLPFGLSIFVVARKNDGDAP